MLRPRTRLVSRKLVAKRSGLSQANRQYWSLVLLTERVFVSSFRTEAHFYPCSLLFSTSLRNSWVLPPAITNTQKLRGGFAKCAYCGQNLQFVPHPYILASGTKATRFTYGCSRPSLKDGRCPGASISVDALDADVAACVKELIRDPSNVDEMITELLKANPINKGQQRKLKNLDKILSDQEALRANLSKERHGSK